MHLSELNPELNEFGLEIDCPGGCKQRIWIPKRMPENEGQDPYWNISGELASLNVSPSIKWDTHSHFNINNGELIIHADVIETHI